MKLNEKILYYRKMFKLSQEELAEQTGVSRQAVSKWELGESTPEVDKLLTLARVFGVTVDELLGGDAPDREPANTPSASTPASDDAGRVVGLLKGLYRRYGWRVGAGLALIGLLLFSMGWIQRYEAMADIQQYLSGIQVFDEDGSAVDVALVQASSPQIDQAVMTMLLGAAALIAGVVWAASVYRKQKNFGQKHA